MLVEQILSVISHRVVRSVAPPMGAVAAALATASLVLAAVATVSQVTNARNDPFADCTVGAGTGRSYVKSEVEPFGVVNPTNPSNIVTVFQQDRWSNGGAHGLAAGVTQNGGRSWTVVPLPFSQCATGTPADLQYERASDPWVSFGPGAPGNPGGVTAYTVSLSFNQSPGKNGNTVGAAVSYDGGLTWRHAQSLRSDAATGVALPVPDSNFQFFHDKESVTADPAEPGHAYVVWDVLIGPNMSVEADLHASAFTAFTLFSRTTDFGRTWSPARVINTNAHPTEQNNQTIGNVIVVDPRNGTLYNFFNQIFNTGSNAGGNPGGAHGFNVAFQKSTDGGDHWSPPRIIAPLLSVGVADPNNVDPRTNEPPAPLRTGDILPAPSIDPATGDLYVVWQDARFSGHDEIVISTSGDGGATWTAPKRVSTPTGQPAFTASVAVSSGAVGVTYYQLGATSPGSMPTTYVIKEFPRSAVTSRTPNSIDSGVAATLVAGPFNMLDAPFALGYFTGDYEALATAGGGFVPVFVQGACGQSLSCRALTSVTPPADRDPTGNDSTDVFVGTGS
ncbi:MAG TPA: sialidase family protein [Chloroflexota bacterium]|jgi:hypothetical protein|nr:sialidase family protein [Chloroflexota bacterium]